MKDPNCIHLSASSVQAFKACPQKFRLAYREGLRLIEDTDSQRVGTNWHSIHEVYYEAYNEQADQSKDDVTDGEVIHNEAHEAGWEAVVELLNQRYEKIPASKTPEEWETERQILLMSFMGP